MFYFDEIDGKKILKSDLIKNAQAFFTTREICICDKKLQTNPHPHLYHSQVREQLLPLPSGYKAKHRNEVRMTEPVCRMAEGWGEGIILKNQKLIADYLKIEQKKLISPTQTHSANVDMAKENRFDYPETDGLILTDKNLAIFLNFADCTPLIFYDEKQNIGAVSHAGWRGTAQKIAQITAQKLINEFGSNPEDICVLIGPSICGKCYEVGEEVYNNFSPTPLPPLSNGAKSGKIDLKEINAKQLANIGIEKIDICPYCTCCDNEYFFSYRKENCTTLRHSAVLKLN